MRCAPISIASAASSPPSKASARRAASSSPSISIQMLVIAGIGIVIGLVLGALMPFAARQRSPRSFRCRRSRHLSLGAGDGGFVRPACHACLCIPAAWPRPRRPGDGAVSRDGFRGRRAAAQTLCLCGRRASDRSGTARHLVFGRPAHRDRSSSARSSSPSSCCAALASSSSFSRGRARACDRWRSGWRSAISTGPAR